MFDEMNEDERDVHLLFYDAHRTFADMHTHTQTITHTNSSLYLEYTHSYLSTVSYFFFTTTYLQFKVKRTSSSHINFIYTCTHIHSHMRAYIVDCLTGPYFCCFVIPHTPYTHISKKYRSHENHNDDDDDDVLGQTKFKIRFSCLGSVFS